MTEPNETRTYRITGRAEHLDNLERALSYMQWLGGWGSSRLVCFFVDGDGAVRLHVEREGTGILRPDADYRERHRLRVEHVAPPSEGDVFIDLG